MKKIFCDCCGEEISNKNNQANLLDEEIKVVVRHECIPTGKSGTVGLSRFSTHGEPLDGFDFCKYCILDAIARLDDRPKDRQATIDDATLMQLANKIEGRLHEGGAPSLRRWQAFVEFRREHNV